jgi:ABC-type Fe3+/spermidine/putrescine transport system ATPase subunit
VENDIAILDWKGLELRVPAPSNAKNDDNIDYFLKHEKILIQPLREADPPREKNRFECTLRDIIFKGQHSDYFVVLKNGEELVGSVTVDAQSLKIRQTVEVSWLPQDGDAFLAENN